jgi:PPOX class probable F420-dependent enzyme
MAFELTEQIERHLNDDAVVWLTTVSPTGEPVPRPIWFLWDNDSIVIYSLKTAARLRNIRSNPRVTVHFNATAEGSDVVVISGLAEIIPDATPPSEHQLYVQKYGTRVEEADYDFDYVDRDFGVAIRIQPQRAWTVV